LFDAAAALCGIRHEVTYEGQAAIELEAACDHAERGAYEMPGLDAREALRAMVADLRGGAPVAIAGARFHNTIAGATAAACAAAASAHGTELVVLSGGVFQNRLLLGRTAQRLERAGLRVLVPERLPPNDGGISFGQVAVAAARGTR
jgi:hydrogenase maturation protein HypF